MIPGLKNYGWGAEKENIWSKTCLNVKRHPDSLVNYGWGSGNGKCLECNEPKYDTTYWLLGELQINLTYASGRVIPEKLLRFCLSCGAK